MTVRSFIVYHIVKKISIGKIKIGIGYFYSDTDK